MNRKPTSALFVRARRVHRRDRACTPSRPLAVACALAFVIPVTASANVVTEWNEIADATTAVPLPMKTRAMAMAQIAVHDALNAIEPRYRSYSVVPTAHAHASPDAAVATAARDVLVATVPAQAPVVNGLYAEFMAALPPCPVRHPACIDHGVLAGRNAADAILDARVGDNADAPPIPYTLAPAPGVHQPTPTTSWDVLASPLFAHWANVTPFGMRYGSQFRARPSQVLRLDSFTYTLD